MALQSLGLLGEQAVYRWIETARKRTPPKFKNKKGRGGGVPVKLIGSKKKKKKSVALQSSAPSIILCD